MADINRFRTSEEREVLIQRLSKSETNSQEDFADMALACIYKTQEGLEVCLNRVAKDQWEGVAAALLEIHKQLPIVIDCAFRLMPENRMRELAERAARDIVAETLLYGRR